MNDNTILYLLAITSRSYTWARDNYGKITGLSVYDIKDLPTQYPGIFRKRNAKGVQWFLLRLMKGGIARQIPVIDIYGEPRFMALSNTRRDWVPVFQATAAWVAFDKIPHSDPDGSLTDADFKRIRWQTKHNRKTAPFYGLDSYLVGAY